MFYFVRLETMDDGNNNKSARKQVYDWLSEEK